MIPNSIASYLEKRGVKGWSITGTPQRRYRAVVVIPSLAESQRLFLTLLSLAQNPEALLFDVLVLAVVNHREDAPAEDKNDNGKTLERLTCCDSAGIPHLAWVDAASPGLEMPTKSGGVGLARKIGADLALPHLDFKSCDPLVIYLDADTVVQPDYLQAVFDHFSRTPSGGAVIPFRHQPADTAAGQSAIDRYELFLRAYVLGLEIAGSPYAFHTVGSAMACRAIDYARMGGMNTRAAGEDFYFLQQLHRVAGVKQLRGTVVHPSARASHRVPFGTGRSMSQALSGKGEAIMYHRSECFIILRDWLRLVRHSAGSNAATILKEAGTISPELGDYLATAGFSDVWAKLQANSKDKGSLFTAFHGWFDGLRTMKMIHYLSATAYPSCADAATIDPLLHLAGEEKVAVVAGRLKLLQQRQFAV